MILDAHLMRAHVDLSKCKQVRRILLVLLHWLLAYWVATVIQEWI